MSGQTILGAEALPSRSTMSGAVLAMTLCAAALIASEFMPVSLLTPLAADLHMTEGQAGQAISVSGIFAVLTSLFVSAAVGRLDRRTVLLGFTLLMVVSGAVVAFAPNYAVMMVGRALLGVSVGGLLFDLSGYGSTFSVSAVMLFASALLALVTWRIGLSKGG